jgi:hypothetical protein
MRAGVLTREVDRACQSRQKQQPPTPQEIQVTSTGRAIALFCHSPHLTRLPRLLTRTNSQEDADG